MDAEVIKEEMSPEEFEQAQAGGMVFKSEKEAKAAAKKYEKLYLAEQERQLKEHQEFMAWFAEREREDTMKDMTDEEKEAFLEKERRRNLPENIMWRQMAFEILQQGAAKRKAKERAERLMKEAEEARRKKIEDQLTMKPA